MGRAARANAAARAFGFPVTTNNPTPAALNELQIPSDQVDAAIKRGQRVGVQCSDRKYAMDEKGTLRRLSMPSPAPPAAPTVGFSGGEV